MKKRMKKMSDNKIDNNEDDLLKILEGSSDSKTEVETAFDDEDKKEADKRMQDLKDLATSLKEDTNTQGNRGSGDLDEDISNWFEGKDVVPSDDITSYISNNKIKMNYGISRNTLSNLEMMGKLRRFIDGSMDTLFSESEMLSLPPDELEDRLKTAFTMYEKLNSLTDKAVLSLNEQRNKFNEDDDIDKLTLLLGSISSDKLQNLLETVINKED